jgi:hypothetical protein
MESNNRPDGPLSDATTDQKKKPYHAPKLHHYGGLAELVQLNPARGADGEVTFIDCTSG